MHPKNLIKKGGRGGAGGKKQFLSDYWKDFQHQVEPLKGLMSVGTEG